MVSTLVTNQNRFGLRVVATAGSGAEQKRDNEAQEASTEVGATREQGPQGRSL